MCVAMCIYLCLCICVVLDINIYICIILCVGGCIISGMVLFRDNFTNAYNFIASNECVLSKHPSLEF